MTNLQIFIYIIFPQAFRKMLPAIISQFVTVIKDTSLLYSVIAIQELFGKSQILMGRYFEANQVFTLYALIAAIYFVITSPYQQFHADWLKNGKKLPNNKSNKNPLLNVSKGFFAVICQKEVIVYSIKSLME